MVKLDAPSAVVCKELLGDMVLISLSPVNSERPKEKQYTCDNQDRNRAAEEHNKRKAACNERQKQ